MTAQQKAARILELSEKATAGPWERDDFHIWDNTGNGVMEALQSKHDAEYCAESRSLAPDVATAMIDAHAAIREFLEAHEANIAIVGPGKPDWRLSAALDALKELV